MKSRDERRQLLKQIIKERDIADQAQLLDSLREKGIESTQATISRDLQMLGVVKVRSKTGGFKYDLLDKPVRTDPMERLRLLFRDFVFDLKGTGNLLIVKTSPGNANSVAVVIDNLERPEILGTIAGDDTILVIADREPSAKAIQQEFNEILAQWD